MQAMKVLVISDIHANLTALEAVLADAAGPDPKNPRYDVVWCLGDLVGYGPDPNACVERVRNLPGLVCLIGNHDQAVLGEIPLSRFNYDARRAIEWTQEVLSEASRDFLLSLPSKTVVEGVTLAHGSPRQPIWEYVLDPETAALNFEAFDTDYCLVGHSHVPLIFHRSREDGLVTLRPIPWGRPMAMEPRMILNPGSVGQPRDMDPRAAYALLDLDNWTWEARRVEYDVLQVQDRILEAGLPERQALRLLAGW